MKRIVATLILLAAINTVMCAHAYLPMNNSGEVVFQQSFTLNGKMNEQDVYTLVQKWFTKQPGEFTRENTSSPFENSDSKNKKSVDAAFNNTIPLQSLDPESNRIVAKGLVKYYGGNSGSIKMLYIEYYIVLQVTGNKVTATISQMKYHHFNQRYASQNIYNWQGGRPIEANDRLENLVNSDINASDMSNLCSFLSKDTQRLLGDLRSYLNAKHVIV